MPHAVSANAATTTRIMLKKILLFFIVQRFKAVERIPEFTHSDVERLLCRKVDACEFQNFDGRHTSACRQEFLVVVKRFVAVF